jgi:citrate lyase subunit beta/citryl-CoA lyase
MPAPIRPRRSVLFMPGSNPRALEKARALPADGLIFDLGHGRRLRPARTDLAG